MLVTVPMVQVAIYQAVYEAISEDATNTAVTWIGDILSIFIDSESRFREDACVLNPMSSTTLCNKELDALDPEIRFRNADSDGDGEFDTVLIDRYNPETGALLTGTGVSSVGIDSIERLWDPSDQLSSLTDTRVITQRIYANKFDDATLGGRHIFTWIDGLVSGTADGTVQQDDGNNEVVAFDTTTFTALSADGDPSTVDPRRYLGFTDSTETDGGTDLGAALVNFIRGQDQSIADWRQRQFNDGTTTVTKRLGDIVNSSPEIVGRPTADYGSRYGDPEYTFFSNRYKDRRQVLYVGANDGMLHAFNAGFYDPVTKGFDLKKTNEVEHPLGAELWAYIPQAALPHLQWLKELQYPHVYYVDGEVQQFDVNIFNDCPESQVETCTHPFGWGTILVVTMRFGGGDITFDPNSDDLTADADADNVTLRSSIMIFDVTDPEQEPVLLAEISDPQLGYTTSKPALYKNRPRNSDGTFNDSSAQWKLYVGSGPSGSTGTAKDDALEFAVSDQNARLFEIDLKTMAITANLDTGSAQANSFVGDITTMDWDNDFIDDAVYFGTVGGTPAAPVGSLMRYRPTFSVEVMLDSDQPITAAPYAVLDRAGRPWVYAGTGRFFVSEDVKSTAQQSFHGILEETNMELGTITAFDKRDLLDTTDIRVLQNGSILNDTLSGDPTLETDNGTALTGVDTFGKLQAQLPETSGVNGWYFDFDIAGRNLLSPVQIRDVLLFDEYIASGDTCDPAGEGNLVNLNLITGTPTPTVIFARQDVTVNTANEVEVLPKVNTGPGMIIGISVHKDGVIVSSGGGGGDGGGLKLGTAGGDIEDIASGRRSWREILLD